MVVPGNVTVEKNRLAGVFPEWGPIFRVSFELKIDSTTKPLDGWMEVLRVTDQGAENSTYVPGRSIPAVWLCSNVVCGGCPPKATCLTVAFYISNNWNEQVCLNISRDRFSIVELEPKVLEVVQFYH